MKKLLVLPVLCYCVPVIAQQMFTGSVINETTRLPVIGATIAIQNSKTVTTTDRYGNFSLTTNDKKINLVVLGKGYEKQVIVPRTSLLKSEIPFQNVCGRHHCRLSTILRKQLIFQRTRTN